MGSEFKGQVGIGIKSIVMGDDRRKKRRRRLLPISKIVIISLLLVATLLSGCGRSLPSFDGQEAYDYIVKQCSFGPRAPNSEGHRQCEQYLFDTLDKYADVTRKQKFTYYDRTRDDTLYLTNIIASFNKDQSKRVLLCAHWDTRPWADEDPDSSLHNQPVMGANDGASGVAVLLTLARIIKRHPLPAGVDIILFDGEDYGNYGNNDNWLLGSKYFVANIGRYQPLYVVLLDMVGDKDLDIYKEINSYTNASWLVNRIWKAASLAKAEHFHSDLKYSLYDDHVPFLGLGIPAADVIDMDYEWWHTTKDIPENCSAESLGEVGRVMVRLLYDWQLQ